jgi:hypothetical protein
MRREYFTLRTQAGEGARPTITIQYDGPEADLQSALRDDAGELLPAEALDVTCRLLEAGTTGGCVLGLTHRLTGEFLLEVNADAPAVLDLVDAARSNGDEDETYRVQVTSEETDRSYDKDTLLVYDGEGNLLRGRSLIPSGVEL